VFDSWPHWKLVQWVHHAFATFCKNVHFFKHLKHHEGFAVIWEPKDFDNLAKVMFFNHDKGIIHNRIFFQLKGSGC
jgi:hypothetical protein